MLRRQQMSEGLAVQALSRREAAVGELAARSPEGSSQLSTSSHSTILTDLTQGLRV